MRTLSCAAAALVVGACGPPDSELEAARRAEVAELAAADVNKDGTLDVIVGYGPSMKDKPGTRFSTIEAFDGRTRKALWANRLPRLIVPGKRDGRSTLALNERYIAFTYLEDPKVGADIIGALSVHDLATGRPRWKKSFPDTPYWSEVEFRVWADGDQLLVLTNPRSSDGEILHAFDFASGAERWQQRVGEVRSTPSIADNSYVMLTFNEDDHPRGVSFVDRHSGALTHVSLPSEKIVIGDDALWVACPSFDPLCEAVSGATDVRYPRDVLVKLDLHTHALTPVRPLNVDLEQRIAIYKDVILEINAFQLVATRIGETKPSWTLDIEIRRSPYEDFSHAPLEADPLGRIPARYLPVLTMSGRMAVIDLATGTMTWTSARFDPTPRTSFVVQGDHYFINLGDANAMVAFNGATGRFDGAFRIVTKGKGHLPNADTFEGQLFASDFQSGRVLGSEHEAEWWMLDVSKAELVASPEVKLLAPWADVEAVLGPVPR